MMPLVLKLGGELLEAAGTEEVLLIDGREPATIAAALRHTSKAEDRMTRIVTAGSPPRLGATS